MASADDKPDPTSETAADDDAAASADEAARPRRFESIFPELLKRGLEKGLEAGLGTLAKTDAIRGAVSEAKLPREIAGYLFSQVDDTKSAIMKVVAGEVRDFLAATDLASELQKALTALSFEVRTEIRFVPNDKGTGVRAEVKAEPLKVRRRPRENPADGTARPRRRRRAT